MSEEASDNVPGVAIFYVDAFPVREFEVTSTAMS